MWKAYGELVNLMASEEVWIADAWWPVVVEVAGKGIPAGLRRRQGRLSRLVQRLRHRGQFQERRPRVRVAEFLDGRLSGRAAVEDRLFLDVRRGRDILEPDLIKQVYGGVGRDGGSLEERAKRVYVWNTRPKNLEYYTEKWNEFLAA